MRKFQIRDCDKDGCGSFLHIEVEDDTPVEEIHKLAEEKINEYKARQLERFAQINRFSFLKREVEFRPTIKVVEIKKKYFPKPTEEELEKAESGGYKYAEFEWITKRGGYKFKLINMWAEFTSGDGTKTKMNGYKAEAL